MIQNIGFTEVDMDRKSDKCHCTGPVKDKKQSMINRSRLCQF